MKNLLIILLVILISGCHLTKKVTKSEAISTQSTQTNETANSKENLKITNNLVTDQKTKKVTVEYYPPSTEPASKSVSSSDQPPASPPDQSPVNPTPNTNTEHGAIKSITTEESESETHDQGISETAKEQQAAKTTVDNSASSVKNDNVEKPAPDPQRWKYIFGILLLLAGAFIYLKRSKVFEIIKPVLSKLAGFLKI